MTSVVKIPAPPSSTLMSRNSFPYPLGSKQVVIQRSEPLPGVVAPVRAAHEVFDDQADVDEADAIVGGQVSLKKTQHTHRQVNTQLPTPSH